MKKLLAALLCLVMVASLFAGCTPKTPDPTDPPKTNPPQTDPKDPTQPNVQAEPIPEAKWHWDFETTDNISAVEQVTKAADSANDGANFDIAASEHEIMTANGPKGSCLYLDGTYGVKLEGLEALENDTYTIAFWVNADRLSTFGPVIQMGRNMGCAPTDDKPVTWLNFTKTEWGASNAAIFPVAWNRNSNICKDENHVDGVWPWMAYMDDAVHGKKEWVQVTIVCTGEPYVCIDDSMDRVGCKYYLNGELMHFATPENGFYQGLAPEIFKGEGVEGYIGINYWDTIFKGYIDELYFFDQALTDGQVLSLFQEGDPTVESTVGGAEEPEPTLPEIVVNEDALEAIGSTARDAGFWTDWTSSFAVADGETLTMKLHNYSNGEANFKNYVAVFCNGETAAHTLPADQVEGYKEWAVCRADAFAWALAGGEADHGTHELSWTDWSLFVKAMQDAEVTLTATRNGSVLTLVHSIKGADGTELTETSTLNTTLTADDACYMFLTLEGCYIELLSVE